MPIIDPFDTQQDQTHTGGIVDPFEQQQPPAPAPGITVDRNNLSGNALSAAEELSKRGLIQFGDMMKQATQELPEDIEVPIKYDESGWPVDGEDIDFWSGVEKRTPDDLTAGEAIISGVKAFPGSAKKQISDLYNAISKPGQTLEGIKNLMEDTAKKTLPPPIKYVLEKLADPKVSSQLPDNVKNALENFQNTPTLDAVIDDYAKSYGSFNDFKNTVAKDPARVLMDLGSIVAPAAKGVQTAAVASKMPGVAKAAGVVSKAAALTEPVGQAAAIAKPISKLVGAPMKFLGGKLKPTKLYQDAAKMSTAIPEVKRIKLVQTALDEGVLPNLEGLNKMDGIIADLDDKIAKAIDAAQAKKIPMPVEEVFKEFDDLTAKYKLSSKPLEGTKAIERIKKNWLKANEDIASLTPEKAQRLKKTVYKDLESYYEAVKSSPASVDAQKSMARMTKGYLEGLVPEIKGLNKRDGAVISLRRALEKPASRIQNRAIVGMGSGIKTGLATTIGTVLGSPELGVAAGISFSILTDPIVQTKIAIAMNKVLKQGGKISDTTVKNLEKMGLKQVKRGGQMLWTPSKRLAGEQVLKASQKKEK